MYAQAVSATPARIDPSRLAIGRGLERQTTTSLMAISSLQKKGPGETLFAEGDEADSVYEIVQGTVRLYKLLPDGRRLITGFLSAGKLLGLAPEGVCIYTAEAVTNVTLCRYKRTALERLMDEAPGFAKRLLSVASHELRAAQDQMLLLGRKTAAEKVASFLLMMAEGQGEEDADELDVPMTRNDIADYLGLTIETVCRVLSKLKQDKLIACESKSHIRICDRDRLEELASGETDTDL
jgi:CRP/FNR family transcriptional regulator